MLQMNMSKTKHGAVASSCSYCLSVSVPGNTSPAPQHTATGDNSSGCSRASCIFRSFPTCPTLRFLCLLCVTVSAPLFQFGFCRCDNCHDQMQLGKEGVCFHLCLHLTVHPWRKPRQEPKAGTEADSMGERHLLAFFP